MLFSLIKLIKQGLKLKKKNISIKTDCAPFINKIKENEIEFN